jgi:hypothetical protein
MQIKSAKDLAVYQKGYELAMKVFRVSKTFPAEEKFVLISQLRRSSRSVCLNLREAWAKRRYEAHFVSKLAESADIGSSVDSFPGESDQQLRVRYTLEAAVRNFQVDFLTFAPLGKQKEVEEQFAAFQKS